MEDTSSKYTFLDPSKTHRVYNPTLKAFQKKAIQSYFQRQQQTSHSNRSSISNINDLTDDSLVDKSYQFDGSLSPGMEKESFMHKIEDSTRFKPQIVDVHQGTRCEAPPMPPRNRSIPLRRCVYI